MLADIYNELVQTELGLISSIDADGDVMFKHPELGSLYIKMIANDPEFFMLVFPNFTSCQSLEISPEQLLLALNAVNGKSKAVKLTVQQHKVVEGTYAVTATVECFLAGSDEEPEPKLLRAVLRRNLAVIRNGASALLAHCHSLNQSSDSGVPTKVGFCLH